jgi:hypothetical protein
MVGFRYRGFGAGRPSTSFSGLAPNAHAVIFGQSRERIAFERFKMRVRPNIEYKHVGPSSDGGPKAISESKRMARWNIVRILAPHDDPRAFRERYVERATVGHGIDISVRRTRTKHCIVLRVSCSRIDGDMRLVPMS